MKPGMLHFHVRLRAVFHVRRHTSQILSAWIAKEGLRTLLSTVRIGGDPHLTRHRLHRFLAWCIDSQIPELLTLATTIDTWWPEINAALRHRHHQRPYRGLQPTCQTGQTRRVRVPQHRELGLPDTIPLHPQTAGPQPRLHADCPVEIEEPS
jgi:hypothetical protein